MEEAYNVGRYVSQEGRPRAGQGCCFFESRSSFLGMQLLVNK